jgi:two-component system sensor histidine kinase QseC
MKLFAQYNRLNILATISIFVVGSCTFYILLRYILVKEMDNSLRSEQQEITQYVYEHHALPEINNTREQRNIYFKNTNKKEGFATLNYDGEDDAYREITFNLTVGGNPYVVVVSKPMDGIELLQHFILLVTIAMIGLILLTALLINRRILNGLWRPFYQTVSQIKSYNLSTPDIIELPATDIAEFTLLNNSLNVMMGKVQHDYEALKKFTGHAAHEMQTPLAIIRTRLDILMQRETVLQEYGQDIADIEQAVQRLSRLNHSLLLLTKVENKQFALNEDVRIDEVINDKCIEFAEILQERDIILSVSVTPFSVRFHRQLAEILIGNLLNNAMRYNFVGGSIDIQLAGGVMSIANTSLLPALQHERVFQRFYRHNDSIVEGNGLGLSIVKQICDFASFTAAYTHTDRTHIFNINFNTPPIVL